jgi:hypothetical protein
VAEPARTHLGFRLRAERGVGALRVGKQRLSEIAKALPLHARTRMMMMMMCLGRASPMPSPASGLTPPPWLRPFRC